MYGIIGMVILLSKLNHTGATEIDLNSLLLKPIAD